MVTIRVVGLVASGWERLHAALGVAAEASGIQCEVLAEEGVLAIAHDQASLGELDGSLYVLAYASPTIAVAAALADGQDPDARMKSWNEEACRALELIEAAPDAVLAVHCAGALADPKGFAECLHLRTGHSFTLSDVQPPSSSELSYYDVAARIASLDSGGGALYESLEASSLVMGGASGEPDAASIISAARAESDRREADRQILARVTDRLNKAAQAEIKPASGQRSLSRIKCESASKAHEGLRVAAVAILKAFASADKARGSLAQGVASEAAHRMELSQLRDEQAAEITRLQAALQDIVAEQGAQTNQPNSALEVNAVDGSQFNMVCELAHAEIAKAEREVELLRGALRLAVDEGPANDHEFSNEIARDNEAEVGLAAPSVPPVLQDAKAFTGMAKWAWVLRAYWQLRRSHMFNAGWYRARYPDLAGKVWDVHLHYLLHGGLEGRSPSLYFCSQTYLNYYPDVRAAELNPLGHYLLSGREEGRYVFPVVGGQQNDGSY